MRGIYRAVGTAGALADNTYLLRTLGAAVHEGFAALRSADVDVTPWKLDLLFRLMPPGIAVGYWRRSFSSPLAEFIFARHARVASDEMAELARECRAFFVEPGIPTRELDGLWRTVEDEDAAKIVS